MWYGDSSGSENFYERKVSETILLSNNFPSVQSPCSAATTHDNNDNNNNNEKSTNAFVVNSHMVHTTARIHTIEHGDLYAKNANRTYMFPLLSVTCCVHEWIAIDEEKKKCHKLFIMFDRRHRYRRANKNENNFAWLLFKSILPIKNKSFKRWE